MTSKYDRRSIPQWLQLPWVIFNKQILIQLFRKRQEPPTQQP